MHTRARKRQKPVGMRVFFHKVRVELDYERKKKQQTCPDTWPVKQQTCMSGTVRVCEFEMLGPHSGNRNHAVYPLSEFSFFMKSKGGNFASARSFFFYSGDNWATKRLSNDGTAHFSYLLGKVAGLLGLHGKWMLIYFIESTTHFSMTF